MKKYAVVFLAWGEKFIKEVESCINQSKAILKYDHILITDKETNLEDLQCGFAEIIRAPFETKGHLRKAEMIKFLPEGYDAYLFLDSDTIVLEDISLGFEKAEKFSIAMSPAPHYSLDHFEGFDRIMNLEDMPCKGQLLYNSGVIFFNNSKIVKSIFERWMALALKYQKEWKKDQTLFTLSMEQLKFNPYTLSISYNYRGFGDAISGVVRIWHSHGELPTNINKFETAWPPRRAWPSKVTFSDKIFNSNFLYKVLRKIKRLTKRLS